MAARLICVLLSLVSFAGFSSALPKYFRGKIQGGFIGSPQIDKNAVLPKPNWIDQQLDHFNHADTQTWSQRYFVNDTFFAGDGPVFLMIGGEGEANPIWMTTGTWIEYAENFKALCLLLEHRYYGKSHPTKDATVKNLAYLSSEQALADLAYFRHNMSDTMDLWDNKWIVFGGSYPGSLAAWFRLKYPHLADGAVATSGPVYAKINFLEFLEVVQNALESTVPGCTSAIEEAVHSVELNLESDVGRQMIKDLFKLCDDIDVDNPKDVSNLFSTLADNFEGVVQYNKDNRAFEGIPGSNITIDVVCGIMVNNRHASALQNFADVNNMLLHVHNETCQDFVYAKMIKRLQNSTWDSKTASERMWTYQTCTEFGWYQSSDYAKQPFGHRFPVDFWTQQCADIFGPNFNADLLAVAVNRTNDDYGGFTPKVTKVVFPNGSIDPWHAMGVTKDLSQEATAIFITGTAHCANMYPASKDDPKELKEARSTIQKLIKGWIEE